MKSIFAHLLIALLVGVVAGAAYGIWYGMVSAKSAQVADLQNQIDTATENVRQVNVARAALSEIAGDEAKIQNYFVSESAIVPFINDLQARGTAENATTSVSSVSTGGSTAQPTLQLAMSIQGTFDAVMRTIGSIEYAPYDLTITTLSVRQNVANTWQANITLSVGSTPTSAAKKSP